MEYRVVEMETMLAFQEQAIERLTMLVDEQQLQLRRLEKHVQAIEDQFSAGTGEPVPNRHQDEKYAHTD